MKIQLPNVSTKYGAPMGRPNSTVSGLCYLQKVVFVDMAYDQGGAYWGMGTPLYVAQDLTGNLFFTRAQTRSEAKALILEHNPEASFFR